MASALLHRYVIMAAQHHVDVWQACVDRGTVMVVSTAASLLIEDIAGHVAQFSRTSALPDPGRWLQLYGRQVAIASS